jgi:endonuclease/exonuclease/phosphatase family metal-dependent hydrolase
MRKLASIALVIFCMVGSAYSQPRDELRVVSWNLQWFPGGKLGASKEEQTKHIETVRGEIQRLNPDILLLQEVGSEGALAETLKPLGQNWQIAIVSRFNQGGFRSGQQLAIAARFPAESAWSEQWKQGWAGAPRGYSYASFMVKGKRVAVYCLHLKSNLGDAVDNISKREDSMEQLIEHTQSKEDRLLKADAIIIGGDFNTDHPDMPAAQSPSERTFGYLYKSGFQWGFEGIEHAQRITCPAKGRYPAACFDHIWTKGLGDPKAKVLKATGSDHLPVAVEFAFSSDKHDTK